MNKIFLIGNLTRDPELTETSAGVQICRFSLAVSRNYAGADGERKTDFFNCTAWRGLAETISRYTSKGKKIAVVGSIEMRNYEDSEGNKRTAIDIIAQDVEFLSPRTTESEPSETPTDTPKRKPKPQLQSFDDDGDIPF